MNQTNQDLDHLKILSILFYVKAGLTTLAMLFCSIYFIFFGALFASINVPHRANEPSPALFGGIFVVVGLVVMVILGVIAFLEFHAGRCLAKQKSYTFCFVIAALVCLSMPLGTILGIFTIIVLMRDSVKSIFNGQNFTQFNNPPNWQ